MSSKGAKSKQGCNRLDGQIVTHAIFPIPAGSYLRLLAMTSVLTSWKPFQHEVDQFLDTIIRSIPLISCFNSGFWNFLLSEALRHIHSTQQRVKKWVIRTHLRASWFLPTRTGVTSKSKKLMRRLPCCKSAEWFSTNPSHSRSTT